jgi:hypothetical protein
MVLDDVLYASSLLFASFFGDTSQQYPLSFVDSFFSNFYDPIRMTNSINGRDLYNSISIPTSHKVTSRPFRPYLLWLHILHVYFDPVLENLPATMLST